MEPYNFDYKCIQTIFKVGKYFLMLPFSMKASYLQGILAMILAFVILYLSYTCISLYWEFQSLLANRLMYTIWYILQLSYAYIIISKHFVNHVKWQNLQTQFTKVEYYFKKNQLSITPKNKKIILDLILSYSIVIVQVVEWFGGYVDFNTLITFGQWKITTFYVCSLFILIRNVAAFIRRRYDFISNCLESLNIVKILQEKDTEFQLDEIANILIDIGMFIRAFNDFFGLEMFFCINIFIVYFTNVVIYTLKKFLLSDWHQIDKGMFAFFAIYIIFHTVSIDLYANFYSYIQSI